MLIACERPIAEIALDQTAPATAEVVGEREVLVRGKALGETNLKIISRDGRSSLYRLVVHSESAQTR
jgi:hypothetical protein